MWAEMIKFRLEPGNDDGLLKLVDQLKAVENDPRRQDGLAAARTTMARSSRVRPSSSTSRS